MANEPKKNYVDAEMLCLLRDVRVSAIRETKDANGIVNGYEADLQIHGTAKHTMPLNLQHKNAIQAFMDQKQRFDMVISTYPDGKHSVPQHKIVQLNQDAIAKMFPDANRDLVKIKLNTGPTDKFVKDCEGGKRVRVGATINFRKSDREIQKLKGQGIEDPKEFYRKGFVSLFMNKSEYEKLPFSVDRSFYAVTVPYDQVFGKNNRFEMDKEGKMNLTLNVWASNFTDCYKQHGTDHEFASSCSDDFLNKAGANQEQPATEMPAEPAPSV